MFFLPKSKMKILIFIAIRFLVEGDKNKCVQYLAADFSSKGENKTFPCFVAAFGTPSERVKPRLLW
jgi:hypothetical protein